MLADGAMVAIVMTTIWLSSRDLQTARWLRNGHNGSRYDCVATAIVVVDPFMQPLSEQRNYAVTGKQQSGCESMKHERRGAAKLVTARFIAKAGCNLAYELWFAASILFSAGIARLTPQSRTVC